MSSLSNFCQLIYHVTITITLLFHLTIHVTALLRNSHRSKLLEHCCPVAKTTSFKLEFEKWHIINHHHRTWTWRRASKEKGHCCYQLSAINHSHSQTIAWTKELCFWQAISITNHKYQCERSYNSENNGSLNPNQKERKKHQQTQLRSLRSTQS